LNLVRWFDFLRLEIQFILLPKTKKKYNLFGVWFDGGIPIIASS